MPMPRCSTTPFGLHRAQYFGLAKTRRPAGDDGNRITKPPKPLCPTGQNGQIEASAEHPAITQRSFQISWHPVARPRRHSCSNLLANAPGRWHLCDARYGEGLHGFRPLPTTPVNSTCPRAPIFSIFPLGPRADPGCLTDIYSDRH